MVSRTKLTKAEHLIRDALHSSPQRVYTPFEIAAFFYQIRKDRILAQHTKLAEFMSFLADRGHLLSVTLRSARYRQQITRYCLGKPSPFELAASLRRSGYLSHGTAAHLHGLVAQIPRTLYVNTEQSAKPQPAGPLTQIAIDRAFSRSQRKSNLSFKHKELTVTILSGKNTARLGVEKIVGPSSECLQVTSLERTLIDIAVRPFYAQGISFVLAAYRSARERLSAEKLVSLLSQLRYVYPYAQAIGFLMQRAGYPRAQYALLLSQVTDFNFYLAHGLKKPQYDGSWRLFHPKDI
jgi:predicted transcriptional regulator of viral defense system